MGWLIVLGLFLITAFVTYGIFANVEEARREQALATGMLEGLDAMGDGRLSAKLAKEVQTVAGAGGSAQEWLQRTRVPYGHCMSEEDCDKKTRCVQCAHFETTEQDVPGLRRLRAQEMELATVADERGMRREAAIHRSVAQSISQHVDRFDKMSEAV